jgi:hypothetical protein
MKKTSVFTMIFMLFLICTLTTLSASGSKSHYSGNTGIALPLTEDTLSIIATVTKIDNTTHTIVLKDQTGKIYTFVVDSSPGIDLTKLKVGLTYTGTIGTTSSTNKTTRTIIKRRLIILQ